jgi:outer membrane protein OmpA-like peptidoglycan-associated protein
LVLALVCVLGASGSPAARAAETPQIPLVPGLRVTFAVVGPGGDQEPSFSVRSVTPDYYEATYSREDDDPRTGRKRTIEVPRRVRMQDQREARVMRSEYLEGDPLTFTGTTPFLSGAMLQELRRGSTTFTDADTGSMFGLPLPRKRRVSLQRVGFEKLPLLVNGRLTDLRVIHARGEIRDEAAGGRDTVDMLVLDDPQNAIYVRWRQAHRGSQVIRIDFPDPAADGARLEAALAAREPLDVYNVYFAFASAELHPESKPALDTIAAVLAKHRDWKLRVVGHTDNIGADPANLQLSERRAHAVREALIRQYRIAPQRLAAGGRGAAGAIATNATPEGRARNRRVVLTRE